MTESQRHQVRAEFLEDQVAELKERNFRQGLVVRAAETLMARWLGFGVDDQEAYRRRSAVHDVDLRVWDLLFDLCTAIEGARMSDPDRQEEKEFPVENGEPLGSLPDAATWLERVGEFGHLAQRGGEGDG